MMHLCTWIYDKNALALSLHALYRKYETNIPRNKTARPRSKFLHSCICERNIYSHDRSAYFAALPLLRLRADRGNVEFAHRYMNLEIGNEAVQFHF